LLLSEAPYPLYNAVGRKRVFRFLVLEEESVALVSSSSSGLGSGVCFGVCVCEALLAGCGAILKQIRNFWSTDKEQN